MHRRYTHFLLIHLPIVVKVEEMDHPYLLVRVHTQMRHGEITLIF